MTVGRGTLMKNILFSQQIRHGRSIMSLVLKRTHTERVSI